jgi:dTDP-4-dehydrorhamnose 3,5-epimerase
MKVALTKFEGLKILNDKSFADKRGYFREILKENYFSKKNFVFWCISTSKKNVVRGLHTQRKKHQEKYVSVIKGKIFDVVVDLRKNSKTFGKKFSVVLSEKNSKSLFIPAGFAHGFCGLEKENIVLYGLTNYRSKKNEIGILWNDKDLKIKWPVQKPNISNKDKKNISLKTFINKFI